MHRLPEVVSIVALVLGMAALVLSVAAHGGADKGVK